MEENQLKYFITFETKRYTHNMFGTIDVAESTWVATEQELEETLKSVARNKHKVVRIVKGHEVPFTQEVRLGV